MRCSFQDVAIAEEKYTYVILVLRARVLVLVFSVRYLHGQTSSNGGCLLPRKPFD